MQQRPIFGGFFWKRKDIWKWSLSLAVLRYSANSSMHTERAITISFIQTEPFTKRFVVLEFRTEVVK